MEPVVFLFAEENLVRREPGESGRAVAILNGLLKVPAGAPTTGTATLTVESSRQPPRVLDKLALHPPPAAGAVSTWKHAIPLVDGDVVTAHWAFGAARSNRVALQIASAAAGAALTIEAIPSIGVPLEPHLFARLRNLTGAPLDRPSAFVDCAAIIDGVRSRYRFDAYHGMAELAAGDSLWQLFSLDRCDPRPAPGEHEVVLEMAGHRSAAARVVTR